MPDIIVSSTTDTQEAVNAAAGVTADPEAETAEVEVPEGEQPETESESETGEEDGEKKEADAKPKGKGGWQRRIDKLTKRNHEVETEKEAIARERDELRKRLEGKPSETPKETAAGKPLQKDYATWEEWNEAVTEWKATETVKATLAKRDEDERQKAEAEYTKTTFEAYNKGVSEERGEHEDFDEVISNPDIRIPQSAQVAMVELGRDGSKVAYYIGMHPEVAEALLEMSPARVAVEIGRIAASLSSEASPPAKTPASKAPAPITPVGRGASTSTKKPDEMDYQEYKAWYAKTHTARSR